MPDRQILIIENDPRLGQIYKHLFETLGVSVTLANDDRAAMESLEKETFHTIMIDQQSLEQCSPDFLPQLPSMIRQKTHLFFLVYDDQAVPTIDHPEEIGVQYLHVPIEPGMIIHNIHDFHLGRGVIDFPFL